MLPSGERGGPEADVEEADLRCRLLRRRLTLEKGSGVEESGGNE